MNEGQKEQFQSTIEIGVQVLKTAILINGSAAIALLTFVGNTNGSVKVIFLVGALKFFSAGIISAAFGGFLAYVAQRLHLGSIAKKWRRVTSGTMGWEFRCVLGFYIYLSIRSWHL